MFNPETNKCLRRLATTSLLSLGFSATAAVNDVLPADFFPLASGTTTFAVYAYDRQFSGPYSRGNKLLDGELSSQIVALRAGHFIDVGGMPVSLVAVLPWSAYCSTPGGSES